MEKHIEIFSKKIGSGYPIFVVAEIGINHNGDINLAREMIRGAEKTGVDAVKFQFIKADQLVSKRIKKAAHQEKALSSDESVYEMWKRLEFNAEQFNALKQEANACGLAFFVSVFDQNSLLEIEKYDMPAYKIASGDLTHLPLIEAAAKTGKPVILSVGMGTEYEIMDAVAAVKNVGNDQVILLQCTSQYPTDIENAHLLKIGNLKKRYGVECGLSDHTDSQWTPAIGVALGAKLVERHFTIDKNLPGTDQKLSADVNEMKLIVEGIRATEALLGSECIHYSQSEEEGRVLYRRGLTASQDIFKGDFFSDKNVGVKRPAHGLPPKKYVKILGKQAKRDILSGEPISEDCV